MAESMRGGTLERDIEQAVVALKKGAHLLKYGRKGKPRLCPFRLSSDEKTLIWYSGKEEMQLNLSAVSRIVPGQRTANFQRHPQPDKEYQSFSLIYGHDDQSLDLICKDKDQAELWFVGIKALINGSHSQKVQVDVRNDAMMALDTSSPIGFLDRRFTLALSDVPHQRDKFDTYRHQNLFGSPPHCNLDRTVSAATLYSVDSRKSIPDSSYGDSVHSRDSGGGSDTLRIHGKDSAVETFRVSLSSVISSSSQGSAQDEDALGDVYMWGEGVGCGHLGGGKTGSQMDALLPKHLDSAVVLDVQNIACGKRHAGLVNRQGEVFSWGEESGGRLGHGMNVSMPHPQIVESLACTATELVACGEYHTCAVTLAGDLYTWGDGSRSFGLLGHGNDVSHWMPRRVPLPEGVRVSSVACGPWHTALITSAGQLFTFGDGTFGVLGHGDRENALFPREVESLKGLKTIKVACGLWHTAAVVEVITSYSGSTCASGKLFTWGDGDKGQLGHGGRETKLLPTCVAALVDHDFRQVACGNSLTAALTTSGQVYTMGSSMYGQLGDPQADGKLPVVVEGKLWEAFVEEISCGAYHVAVLTSKTEVYTWGRGANGRLGHGDVHDRHTPTRVEALKDKQVKSITCGASFTAAICLHKLFSGADQSICSGCRMPFVFTRKRHNCYNCGNAFCHGCSSKKASRATLAPNPKKSYRVCDSCYVKLKSTAEAGTASQRGRARKGFLMQQPLEIQGRKEKSEVKNQGSQLSTPRIPLFDGRTILKPNKKHESLRRVSPAPTDLISWGSMPGTFDPTSALIKSPMLPTSISSSRNMDRLSLPPSQPPSPPRSTSSSLATTKIWSQDFMMSELREANRALHEEVLMLRKQVGTLKQCCQRQETELQNAMKEIQEGRLVAKEEAAKCRAAKEVIKSLTLQLKEMTTKMPTRMVDEKGPSKNLDDKETDASPSAPSTHLGGPNLSSTTSRFTGLSGKGASVLDLQGVFNSSVRIARDMEFHGAKSPYLPHQTVVHGMMTPPPRKEDPANLRNALETPNGGHQETEWVEQDQPGVYITFMALPGGGKDLKRVRFSRKKFGEKQAEQWWAENRARVYDQYNILGSNTSVLSVIGETPRANGKVP